MWADTATAHGPDRATARQATTIRNDDTRTRRRSRRASCLLVIVCAVIASAYSGAFSSGGFCEEAGTMLIGH
jgi:hypothetical protein